MGLLLVIFGKQFLSLFTADPEVITAGLKRLTIMGFSYGVSAFMDCTIAASTSPWKESGSHVHRDHGFLCIPCCMGLHCICLL